LADPYKLFLDFDGTITSNDVGYEMFKKFTFSATEPLVQAYRRGELNSLECLSRECDVWNDAAPNMTDVYSFLDKQALREGFASFVIMLEKWKIKPLILSEGFNFYIDRVLSGHSQSHLERITNIARVENGRLSPKFPYYNLGCGKCSSCKGYHIRQIRPATSCAIYIGDGHSDFHASIVADIVFARSHLMELLEDSERSFIPYNNFGEIGAELENIIQIGLFAQSNRANLCRLSPRHRENFRALWESGEVMRHVGYPHGLGWSKAYFDSIWPALENDDKAIRLALEDKSGNFMGEAMIPSPDNEGICQPDLKLFPEFWGRGLGHEGWGTLIDRLWARWPETTILVTPNIENPKAIELYDRLGFEFDGGERTWQPSPNENQAISIRYRRMIKKNIANDRNL
jgi:2-hydroxy-3-keto-5-methylthiopentenyl-1-phosphate phosphatase